MNWKHFLSHFLIAIFAAALGTLFTLHFVSTHSQSKITNPVSLLTNSPTLVYSDKPNVVNAVKRLGPAVVNITTVSIARTTLPEPFNHFFHDFLNDDPFAPFSQPYKMEGAGSGVIVDKNGLIVTNEHVIHNANNITITLTDNRKFQGKVIGSDKLSDLAIVKTLSPPKDLPVAVLGNSDRLQIGEWVVAIGNPYGFHNTVTVGVLSGSGRTITGEEKEYQDLLQTDAAINPGNSGGPLADLTGSIIGINTAIIPYAQGIGFAIPINLVKRVATELIQNGRVRWPFLGINMEPVAPQVLQYLKLKAPSMNGAVVVKIIPHSPAEKSGIQPGDIITEISGKKIEDPESLARAIHEYHVGDKITLKLYRKGQFLNKVVELEERPQ